VSSLDHGCAKVITIEKVNMRLDDVALKLENMSTKFDRLSGELGRFVAAWQQHTLPR
jgi:hypothetical protein